jgi:antitoxin (DNA-binding transcriptional repressor) of toxin-antitoxin stability system
MTTYSSYDARAKFSEILRRVRAGETVRITYHGEEVAEIRRIEAPATTAAAVERLVAAGIIDSSEYERGPIEPLATRPGSLERFLADRE